MLNTCTLIGRPTKDPELRYTTNGQAVATFALAVDRTFAKEGQKETDFIGIVVWAKQAEIVAQYLRKGKLCAIVGRIQTRSYEGDKGKVFVTEVVAEQVKFLERKTQEGGLLDGAKVVDDLPFQ